MNTSKIKCPNCATEIDVNELLAHQLENKYKEQYAVQVAEQRRQFEAKQASLAEEKISFEAQKKKDLETIELLVSAKMKKEKEVITASLKAKFEEEQGERIVAMQKELNEKSLQVVELNKAKSEIEKMKRTNAEMK